MDERAARERMVAEQIEARGIHDAVVLQALRRVPRHCFVPAAQRAHAYADGALAIGGGQTISQPYIVALMTAALAPRPGERLLEVGTGSGYQTAVLAATGATVYTIERHAALAEAAREVLATLGYDAVHYRIGDGTLGWPEEAPFHGIIVTAAAPEVPATLSRQLALEGRLVVPIGSRGEQELCRFVRTPTALRREPLTRCRFVPLVGAEGWGEE
jgi:protein-L-isoaspartate(D-aspartate) O-methyltransferase